MQESQLPQKIPIPRIKQPVPDYGSNEMAFKLKKKIKYATTIHTAKKLHFCNDMQ